MSNQPSSLEKTGRDDPLDPQRTLSAEALQRRRMLLKGAGSGGVALAAMTPLSALATNGVMVCTHKQTGKNVIATVSGVNSAAASFAGGQVPPTAGGRKPSTWCNIAKTSWPKLASGATCWDKRVDSVIGWASGCKAVKLYDFMGSSYTANYATEQQWVCAYLNALAYERRTNVPGYHFPYTSSEVLSYISTRDPKANAFFSVYMASL